MAKRFTFHNDNKNIISHNIFPQCLIECTKLGSDDFPQEDAFDISIKGKWYRFSLKEQTMEDFEDKTAVLLAIKKAAKWYKAMMFLDK